MSISLSLFWLCECLLLVKKRGELRIITIFSSSPRATFSSLQGKRLYAIGLSYFCNAHLWARGDYADVFLYTCSSPQVFNRLLRPQGSNTSVGCFFKCTKICCPVTSTNERNLQIYSLVPFNIWWMTSFLLANCEHFKRAIDANNQLCKKLILNKGWPIGFILNSTSC